MANGIEKKSACARATHQTMPFLSLAEISLRTRVEGMGRVGGVGGDTNRGRRGGGSGAGGGGGGAGHTLEGEIRQRERSVIGKNSLEGGAWHTLECAAAAPLVSPWLAGTTRPLVSSGTTGKLSSTSTVSHWPFMKSRTA